MKLYRLETSPPSSLVMCSGKLAFFDLTLDGYALMYALDVTSAYPLRQYVLTNEFAYYLGFYSAEQMRAELGIAFRTPIISTRAIKRRLKGRM